ncbi:MAG: GldG family protein [Deltaproteobacteria bacterium]|nr:GldG family protein [Deltaproteobacteria bacterium]
MSPSTLSYVVGMLAMFVGQRILNGIDLWQMVFTAVGAAALLVGAVLRVRAMRKATNPGSRLGHRLALILLLVGVASLVLYVGTTETFTQRLSLDDAGEKRWLGLSRSLWMVVWLIGTVPLLVVDYALHSSPVMVQVRRVRETVVHGLVAAMGLSMVFPLNYVATQRNDQWDLAYFKTPTPGTATQALVEALDKPVHVRIFMPPSSEVAQELRNYFAKIEGPQLSVEIIDQAANPRLAKALVIRDNGTVAMTQGDISVLMDEPAAKGEGDGEDTEAKADERPRPVTTRLRVNPDLDKAKKTLKKLDAEVKKMLIELGQGERVAYFTAGHGELNWSQQKEMVDVSIRALRARMLDLGFSIKMLGLKEGLAEQVPEDASLVLVIGPRAPFLKSEVDTLENYLTAGGSLLLARDPRVIAQDQAPVEDPLDDLMTHLGVKMGDGVLAAERGVKPLTRSRADVFNLMTDSFSTHPASSQLAAPSNAVHLLMSGTGFLEEIPEQANGIVFVARSLAVAWAEVDINTRFDSDKGETKEARNLVAAIEGGGEDSGWRALVSADAQIFSDLGVGLSLGNQFLIDDSLGWLIGAESLAGTTQNEEDIKIEHSKEGQQWWFYLAVLFVPLGVVTLGAVRLRLRRRGGAAR